MEKTRDLFKKIRYTKRTFHAKMGTIKDRNSMDLTEAEDEEVARIHRRTIQKKMPFHHRELECNLLKLYCGSEK